jgi:hypothetical protein
MTLKQALTNSAPFILLGAAHRISAAQDLRKADRLFQRALRTEDMPALAAAWEKKDNARGLAAFSGDLIKSGIVDFGEQLFHPPDRSVVLARAGMEVVKSSACFAGNWGLYLMASFAPDPTRSHQGQVIGANVDLMKSLARLSEAVAEFKKI